jgi:coatomer subunit beta
MAAVATASVDKTCSILVQFEKGEPANVSQLRTQLETGTEQEKLDGMKRLIGLIQAGENMSQLLMTVVRFIMPMRNKLIKKLLLIYLEVIDKTSADGKLLPEMILVV